VCEQRDTTGLTEQRRGEREGKEGRRWAAQPRWSWKDERRRRRHRVINAGTGEGKEGVDLPSAAFYLRID